METAVISRPIQTATGYVVQISQRPKDGYIDVTALCQAAGKFYNDWYRRRRTERFLASLGSAMGIPIPELIQVLMGRNGDQHTFAHPKVATSIAQWCSPEFEAQVCSWFVDYCPHQKGLQRRKQILFSSVVTSSDGLFIDNI